MRIVKKPKTLRFSPEWRIKADAMHYRGKVRPFICFGREPAANWATPDQARRISAWMLEYARWAESLEPEFDERNE